MTEKVLVTDSNIFFDLLSVELFDSFFKLPYEIHTTDFVVAEITEEQQKSKITDKIKSNSLFVKSFESSEMSEIVDILHKKESNATIADISVWHYARKISSTLLTGDAKLRHLAEKDGIKVSGILYVFESLITSKIITEKEAAERLVELLNVNPRLPHGECSLRIEKWRSSF